MKNRFGVFGVLGGKPLFWSWFVILLILNVIPLGNETNHSLSSSDLLSFRLDYLVHAISFLAFAWIWILGRVLEFKSFGVLGFRSFKVFGFKGFKVLGFAVWVFASAVGFELVQFFIPWRSFNPVDMVYNVVGAFIAVFFVIISYKLRVTSDKFKKSYKLRVTSNK